MSTELPARLTNVSRAQVFALLWLQQHGEALRERNYFAVPASHTRYKADTIEAMVKRGLAKIVFAGGRHRARLTDEGGRYARTAAKLAQPEIPPDILMAG